jgi:hypothetical protein
MGDIFKDRKPTIKFEDCTLPQETMEELGRIGQGWHDIRNRKNTNVGSREERIAASIHNDSAIGFESPQSMLTLKNGLLVLKDGYDSPRRSISYRLDDAGVKAVTDAALKLAHDPKYLELEAANKEAFKEKYKFEDALKKKYADAPNATTAAHDPIELDRGMFVDGRVVNVDPADKKHAEALKEESNKALIAAVEYIETTAKQMGISDKNALYVHRAINASYQDPETTKSPAQQQGAAKSGGWSVA